VARLTDEAKASTKSGTPKLKKIAVERRQAARPPIMGVVAQKAITARNASRRSASLM
jgi:hypothetical protein